MSTTNKIVHSYSQKCSRVHQKSCSLLQQHENCPPIQPKNLAMKYKIKSLTLSEIFGRLMSLSKAFSSFSSSDKMSKIALGSNNIIDASNRD